MTAVTVCLSARNYQMHIAIFLMSLYDQATWLHKYRWDERLVQWIRKLRARPVIIWAKTDDVRRIILHPVIGFLTIEALWLDSFTTGICPLRTTEWGDSSFDIRSCLRSDGKHPFGNRSQLQDSWRSISTHDNRFDILEGYILTISECFPYLATFEG